MSIPVYDVIGIGFGPANIALAIALEEFGFDKNILFLEKYPTAKWQPDMLLAGSDIQHNPIRDLVSLRNPRSRYSFINFLHENDLLLDHLNLDIEFPLRKEYAKYISWVAGFFEKWVHYNQHVKSIRLFHVHSKKVYQIETSDKKTYFAKSLVVAPGRTPHIPSQFEEHLGNQVFHLTDYLTKVKQLKEKFDLHHGCVVGSSQSAIEIVLDLANQYPDMLISNVMRKCGYRLKDTSQFSEQIYFPQFVDYYYACDTAAKKKLNQYLHYTNYSAADHDVITDLNTKIYEEKLDNRNRIKLYSNQEISLLKPIEKGFNLHLTEINLKQESVIENVDFVVLATGFKDMGNSEGKELFPNLLAEIIEHFQFNEELGLYINRDYSLKATHMAGDETPSIYLNGLCESSHGYGDAGSFSLLSLRSAEIGRSLIKKLAAKENQKEKEISLV